MIIRNLDANGDWSYGTGIAALAKDERAIEINLRTRLLSWVGNCFFDLTAGIDWSTRLDKGQAQNLVNDLRALILQSYGVVGINSVSYNLDAQRNIRVQYDIVTVFSPSFKREVQASAGVA